MSNDRQQVSYGHTHQGIGVARYAIPKEVYEPNKHNSTATLRAGSMEAFKQPSLNHVGERKPYWGTKE